MKLQASAYQKFIHTTPRKLRLVADSIRGQEIKTALEALKFSSKFAAETISKILTAAQANALNTLNLSSKDLRVKEIVVEEGPRIKRWRPVSRGMAHSIIKRTSHVKIVVEGEAKTSTKQSTKKEGQ